MKKFIMIAALALAACDGREIITSSEPQGEPFKSTETCTFTSICYGYTGELLDYIDSDGYAHYRSSYGYRPGLCPGSRPITLQRVFERFYYEKKPERTHTRTIERTISVDGECR